MRQLQKHRARVEVLEEGNNWLYPEELIYFPCKLSILRNRFQGKHQEILDVTVPVEIRGEDQFCVFL